MVMKDSGKLLGTRKKNERKIKEGYFLPLVSFVLSFESSLLPLTCKTRENEENPFCRLTRPGQERCFATFKRLSDQILHAKSTTRKKRDAFLSITRRQRSRIKWNEFDISEQEKEGIRGCTHIGRQVHPRTTCPPVHRFLSHSPATCVPVHRSRQPVQRRFDW